MAGEVAKGFLDIEVRVGDSIRTVRQLTTEVNAFQLSLNSASQKQAEFAKKYTTAIKDIANSTGVFTAETARIATAASVMDKTLSKGQGTLGQFFSAKFNKNGAIAAEVMGLAKERVSALNTSVIATTRSVDGFQEVIKIKKLSEFSDVSSVAAQKQQILSTMLKQGTTNLINFGKNVQWAGRQLMVGFTVPLTIFGNIAGKTFMDLEKQVVAFKKVYGDVFTTPAELDQNLKAITGLAKEYTKYGIAVKDTIGLAAQAAAAGRKNADLTDAVGQATRLATLGQMEQNAALETTISLQSAFKLSGKELADSINFLNMVENQTVVSLQDLSAAIPRVAPVIVGLGGDVKDLAVFLAAMQEGGVDASEGANALKSGLASLINPTKQATQMLSGFGINLDAIVQTNKGDLMGTVMAFSEALSSLDQFSRQQALEQVFGKFQYAKLGALFENISREGSQAQQVIQTMGYSTEQLGATADKELKAIEESFGVKLTAAVENFKLAIAPIGEIFVKNAIPIINMFTKIAEGFNGLSDGKKQFIAIATAIVGVVIPAGTMMLGLFMNLTGTLTKFVTGFATFTKSLLTGNVKKAFQDLGGGAKYLSLSEIDAAVAAQQLSQASQAVSMAFQKQIADTNILDIAVNKLASSLGGLSVAQMRAATSSPEIFGLAMNSSNAAKGIKTGGKGFKGLKRNAGGPIVPGVGNTDTVPAMLTPGEFVVNKDATRQNYKLLEDINSGKANRFNSGGRVPGVQYFGKENANRQVLDATDLDAFVESNSQISRVSSSSYQRSHILDQKEFRSSLEKLGYEIPANSKHLITTGWYGQVSKLPRHLNEIFGIFESSKNVRWSREEEALIRRGFPIDANESKTVLGMMEKIKTDSSSYKPAQAKLLEYSKGVIRPIDDILSGMALETDSKFSGEMLNRIRQNPKSLQQELINHIVDGIENKNVELYSLESGASAAKGKSGKVDGKYAGTKQGLGKLGAIRKGKEAELTAYLKDMGRLISKKGVRANAGGIMKSILGKNILKSLYSTRGGLPSGAARVALNERMLQISAALGLTRGAGIKTHAPMSRPNKQGEMFINGMPLQRGHVAAPVKISDNSSYHPGLMFWQGAGVNQNLAKSGATGQDLLNDFKKIEASGLHPASLMLAGIEGQGHKLSPEVIRSVESAYNNMLRKFRSENGRVFKNEEFVTEVGHILKNSLDPVIYKSMFGVGTIRTSSGGSIGTGVIKDGIITRAHGPIQKAVMANSGGLIWSPNGPTVPGFGNTDTVPAMLTPGEFVVNKDATKDNFGLLKSINDGGVQKFGIGGFVAQAALPMAGYAAGQALGNGNEMAGMAGMMAAGAIPEMLKFKKSIGSTTESMSGIGKVGRIIGPRLAGLATPVGLAVAGFAVLGFGVYKLNKTLTQAEKSGAEFTKAMYGTAKTTEKIAEAFGRQTFAQQARITAAEKAGGQEISQEAQQISSGFVQSEAGQQMLKDVGTVKAGGGDAVEALRNQLSSAIIAGAINTEEARAIAVEIGSALKDEKIGVGVSAEITKLMGPDGKDMLKNISTITAEISPKINSRKLQEDAEKAYSNLNVGEKFVQFWQGGDQSFKENYKMQQSVSELTALLQRELEAMQLITIAYKEGAVSLEEFNKKRSEINSGVNSSQNTIAKTLGYSDMETLLGVGGLQYAYTGKGNTKESKVYEDLRDSYKDSLKEIPGYTDEIIQETMDNFDKIGGTIYADLLSGEIKDQDISIILDMQSKGMTYEKTKDLLDKVEALRKYPNIEKNIDLNNQGVTPEGINYMYSILEKIDGFKDPITKDFIIETFGGALAVDTINGIMSLPEEIRKSVIIEISTVQAALPGKLEGYYGKNALEDGKFGRAGLNAVNNVAKEQQKIIDDAMNDPAKYMQDPTDQGGGGSGTDWKKNLNNRFDLVDKRLSMETQGYRDLIDLKERENTIDQRKIEINNRALSQLSKQEEEVNNRYNERIDLLDGVAESNDRLREQESSRVDLARALAEGNVSTAAQIMGQMTANEANYRIEDTRAALENQKEEDLKNLRVDVNGVLLTREQIQANIDTIEETIYQRNIQSQELQDKIYAIEQQRLQNTREREKVETRLFLLEQQKAIVALQGKKVSKGLTAEEKSDLKNYKDAYNQMASSYNSMYPGENIPQVKMYGGKIKKFAMGSVVPGIGSTDKVPALLTPGEFVVRKSAAQANMSLLEMINNGVFPKMSGPSYNVPSSSIGQASGSPAISSSIMYNDTYNINVSVAGTGASPDDIANVVMSKLSQQNRGSVRSTRY